jgi:hypothetical protein
MAGHDLTYKAPDGHTAFSLLVTNNNPYVTPELIRTFGELLDPCEVQRCFDLYLENLGRGRCTGKEKEVHMKNVLEEFRF